MIIVIVSLFFSASLAAYIMVAACMIAGRRQETGEEQSIPVSIESSQSIAEVELPKYNQRSKTAPAHTGI